MAAAPSHGLMIGTPIGEKSSTLRVTTVIPWISAVAAMSASRTGRIVGHVQPGTPPRD